MPDETSSQIEKFVEQLQSSSALTFARSLFHAAEGKELFDQAVVFASAVSPYYSLFHLGGALMLAYCSGPVPPDDPHAPTRTILEKQWRTVRARTLSNGVRYLPDPAERIPHKYVPPFLQREVPEIFQSLGQRDKRGTLWDMREFVSYAPRMVCNGHISVLYSGCQYEPQDFKSHLSQHLGRIDQFFCSAAGWLKQRHNEVYLSIVSGDFILFEFAELRSYHPPSVVKRAWALYRAVCECEGTDWRVYRSRPGTWHTDEQAQCKRYEQVVRSFTSDFPRHPEA